MMGIRLRRARTCKLFVHVLPFGNLRPSRQQVQIRAMQGIMDIGATDLDSSHAAFAGQETRERDFELAVGEEEDRLTAQDFSRLCNRFTRTGTRRSGHLFEFLFAHTELCCDGAQPCGRAALS